MFGMHPMTVVFTGKMAFSMAWEQTRPVGSELVWAKDAPNCQASGPAEPGPAVNGTCSR